MINHAYISLFVKDKLNKSDADMWFNLVATLLPVGVISSAYITIDERTKLSDHYVKKTKNGFKYIIPLSRDLLDDEAGIVAVAFDRKYENDFVINFSQTKQMVTRKREQQVSVFEDLSKHIAKKMHNEWLEDKVDAGWGYGPMYNQATKRNPLLRPWDQLNEIAKLEETTRILKMLKLLDSINLKIVRK